MPFLRLKLPNQSGDTTHVLRGERVTIGREPGNTIQIPDRSVSACHAELIADHGHYRLHDLDSTNMTCVDGCPITDFHLHVPCRVKFGAVEAEFLPDAPPAPANMQADMAPTRAEIEYLMRDNRDLQSKVGDLQRRIEILGVAAVGAHDSFEAAVTAEAHRRVVEERDALRAEVAALKIETESFQCDIAAILRDRDALRQAWSTVKAELADAERVLRELREQTPRTVA